MNIRLTKKGKIVLFVILGIVVLGSGGFLLWRVLQEETVAPEEGEAVQQKCGEEPTWYQFNRLPSTIGPIEDGGIIVLYYKNLLSHEHKPQLVFSYEDTSGATQTESIRIPTLDSNGRAKVITGIEIPPGGMLTLTGLYDTPPNNDAAWGWEAPNSDQTCGSGLLGPPTGGKCEPYPKRSVSSDISWAQNDDETEILSTQCWADSKEWVGDYDFEDYFLQIGYIPLEENICEGGEWVDKPSGQYEYGTALNPITVRNTDPDGLGEVTVTLNGSNVIQCGTVVGTTCYSTDGDDIELLVDPGIQYITPGTYDLTISWKDGKGVGGDNCTLSTTFTILEEEQEPSCGDGTLDEGEECEQGDPEGYSCLWPECNQDTCTCPEEESSCGDGILEDTEECELGNPTGYSCLWEECNQDTCLCPEVQENPDWTMTKEGTAECIVEDNTTYAKGTYTITVTNVGEATGNIDKIVDEVDVKVRQEYLNNISNSGTYDASLLTWDLQGEEEVFDPEESQTFTYYLKIPQDSYGRYENIATAYPTEGDNFTAEKYLDLECDIPEEEEATTTVPQTGIFDSVIVKIVSGVILILLGLNWGSVTNIVSKLNYSRKEYISDRRMEKFEQKVKKTVQTD
jgi:hypothetical protein